MKKFFKIFCYLILVIIIFTIYEVTSIDSKYINRSTLDIDINNIRNPQIKKLVRLIDNFSGNLYFQLSKKKQDEFYNTNEEKYNSLPGEIYIPAKLNDLTLTNGKSKNNLDNWKRSHGNHSSNKFSNLKLINTSNVHNLDVAWTHSFEVAGDIPGNPIYLNGKIYLSSTNKSLVSFNASDGKKNWEHKTEGMAATRGLIIKDGKKPIIYFCDQINLIALYAEDGKLVKNFGNDGKIKLKKKCQITPVIIDDKIIIGTFEPSIEVYDIKKGNLLWRFYLKKKENNYFRYGGKRFDYSGGNPWGGISADVERKIVYVSTGNAGRFYEGTSRPGKNKYSNSIVAIDIENKKLLWEFQEIEHDIWNFDIASPPILTSIQIEEKKIDVVVVPTKFGNTLVLDRLTGNNIFSYINKKVPLSNVPGEKTSYYQKIFSLPEPFSRQFFEKKDITNLSKERSDYIKSKIKDATYGFFIPHSINKKNIIYKGGAQWMGASVDNSKGIMYVPSNDVPVFVWLKKNEEKNSYYRYKMVTEFINDQYGYPGSRPPWGKLTAIDLNSGKIIWSKPFGEYEELTVKNIPLTGTFNYGGVTGTAGDLIFATGTLDNKIRAFNSNDGNELWNYRLPFSGSSPPTIFKYKNEQYVLVVATGSISMRKAYPKISKSGNKIFMFKLKR